MNKEKVKSENSSEGSENASEGSGTKDEAEKPHSLCTGCPYGRNREFCFPCWKHILGQEGYH